MKNEKQLVRGIRTHDLLRDIHKYYPLGQNSLYTLTHDVLSFYHKKYNFLHQKKEKSLSLLCQDWLSFLNHKTETVDLFISDPFFIKLPMFLNENC